MRAYLVEHSGGAFRQVELTRPTPMPGQVLLGVFTLLPLLTGIGQAHHGEILREVAALADAGKLKPLLSERRFSPADIAEAHALVEAGALGKVVVEL